MRRSRATMHQHFGWENCEMPAIPLHYVRIWHGSPPMINTCNEKHAMRGYSHPESLLLSLRRSLGLGNHLHPAARTLLYVGVVGLRFPAKIPVVLLFLLLRILF